MLSPCQDLSSIVNFELSVDCHISCVARCAPYIWAPRFIDACNFRQIQIIATSTKLFSVFHKNEDYLWKVGFYETKLLLLKTFFKALLWDIFILKFSMKGRFWCVALEDHLCSCLWIKFLLSECKVVHFVHNLFIFQFWRYQLLNQSRGNSKIT